MMFQSTISKTVPIASVLCYCALYSTPAVSFLTHHIQGRHGRRSCPPHGTRNRGRRRRNLATLFLSSSAGERPLMEVMSESVSRALDRPVELKPSRSGGGVTGGGGGASVSVVMDTITNEQYFVKAAPIARGGGTMLRAEFEGVKAMSQTDTIRVPRPIAYGEGGPLNTAFGIFEFLDMVSPGAGGGGGNSLGYELGVQLAQMHRSTSDNHMFGFHVNNTIGATPQPNPWTDDWADFWDEHRLGHMLRLTSNMGYSTEDITKLRSKTRRLLSHRPIPSLLHGDLWGGNKGYAKVVASNDGSGDSSATWKVVPVIFDPATYYGDREAEIALTGLFGGYGSDFYEGYNSEWKLPEDYPKRIVVYNLYHILNHVVLFGGGYRTQAKGMIEEILRM